MKFIAKFPMIFEKKLHKSLGKYILWNEILLHNSRLTIDLKYIFRHCLYNFYTMLLRWKMQFQIGCIIFEKKNESILLKFVRVIKIVE